MGAPHIQYNGELSPPKHPLLEVFVYGVMLGVVAAASHARLLEYGFDPVPYLYMPVGHWTYIGTSVWSFLTPLLFFKVLKPMTNFNNRKARAIGFVTGTTWAFSLLKFIIYLWELYTS